MNWENFYKSNIFLLIPNPTAIISHATIRIQWRLEISQTSSRLGARTLQVPLTILQGENFAARENKIRILLSSFLRFSLAPVGFDGLGLEGEGGGRRSTA